MGLRLRTLAWRALKAPDGLKGIKGVEFGAKGAESSRKQLENREDAPRHP
jgi:hypothetical protein